MKFNELVSIILEEQDKDIDYFQAVKNKDRITLRRLLNQQAKNKGYNIGPIYRGDKAIFNKFDLDHAMGLATVGK